MAHASVQFDVDDSEDNSCSSDIDVKEEPLSDEVQSDGATTDADASATEIEVKEEYKQGVNLGMAAVMAKILNKSSEGPAIMSKSVSERLLAARKRRHLDNAEPGADLEVVKAERGDSTTDKLDLSRKRLRKTKQQTISMQEKLAKEQLCHTLPDPLDRSAELNLIKIATRGVVQLFNAVKQQQGKIKQKVSEVKKSVRKTDKALSQFTSGDFLDQLKTQKVKMVVGANDAEKMKQEVKEEPTWSALRDDFMMEARSMKDWDKQEGENDVSIGDASVEDSDEG